jgi:hypothetical protein
MKAPRVMHLSFASGRRDMLGHHSMTSHRRSFMEIIFRPEGLISFARSALCEAIETTGR